MVLPLHNAALAILCRRDGTVIEVLHNEFDLTSPLAPGRHFKGIVADPSVRKAGRFLRTARAHHSALDWQLDVRLAHGITPLFFSGSLTGAGIVILGTKDSLATPSVPIVKSGTVGARQPDEPKTQRHSRKAGSEQLQILEIAAHDLRNPIGGILAASEFLIEDAANVLEEHHLALLRSIKSSSELVLNLIDQMLEMPLMEAEKPKMYLRSTNIVSLVDQSVAMSRPLAESKNIRLEVNTRCPIFEIYVDPLKMTQAITALLTNEIRCSRPGGKIEILVEASDDTSTLTVRDQGPGISADDLRTLFDPLESNRPKRGLKEARTALTLAIVKRIVEAHGGTIGVESELGKGSSFTLRLVSRSVRASRKTPDAAQKTSESGAGG